MIKKLLTLILIFSFTAQAEKMDIETHSIVIEKLEKIILDWPTTKREKDKWPIYVRLGDLYSERSRLRFLKEHERNCDNCLDSKSDRRQALKYYHKSFQKVSRDLQGQMITHMAHLHVMLGENEQARKLYKRILRGGKELYGSLLIAQSNFGIGEIEFRRGKFKKAKRHFLKALSYPKTPRKGLLNYRLAWTELNIGNQKSAIFYLKRILKNPDLLRTKTAKGFQVDLAFQEDVSRDLATFMARGKVNSNQIKELVALSPNQAIKSNLFHLGKETDRLGKKWSSISVWYEYLRRFKVDEVEQLEIQIRLSQLEFDVSRHNLALKSYNNALETWRTRGCKDESICDDLNKRLRNFVVFWNKKQKSNPSKNLSKAYLSYTRVFKNDIEMQYWSAGVHRHRKSWKNAIESYKRSVSLSQRARGGSLKTHLGKDNLNRVYKGSLLGVMECAELSKNKQYMVDAYIFYLDHESENLNSNKVRYQLAQTYYGQKKYDEASKIFYDLANSKKVVNKKLKVDSANLALDVKLAQKDLPGLVSWSQHFAAVFPKNKKEYKAIELKAVNNQISKALRSKNQKNLLGALALAQTVRLNKATKKQKVDYYKNRILVGKAVGDLDEVDRSARNLYKISGLSDSENEWALEQRFWVAEVKFDFAKAYYFAKKMRWNNLSERDKHLKLAIYAELAGKNPSRHYRVSIKKSNTLRVANVARVKLIEGSRTPWGTLKKQLSQLSRSPDLLAAIAVNTFGKYENYSSAEKVVEIKNVRFYADGKVLDRSLMLRELNNKKISLSKHRIKNSSQHLLKKSIDRRIAKINDFEKFTSEIIRKRDWSLQILSFNVLSDEYNRLYKDLTLLPIPKQLPKDQVKDYKKLVRKQAEPFFKKGSNYKKQSLKLWAHKRSILGLKKEYKKANMSKQKVLERELNALIAISPRGPKSDLKEIFKYQKVKPSDRELRVARQKVRKNPFDLKPLLQLIQLEKKNENGTMVAFLESRAKKMKRGEK